MELCFYCKYWKPKDYDEGLYGGYVLRGRCSLYNKETYEHEYCCDFVDYRKDRCRKIY